MRVAIVGAGICGSYLALKLKQKNPDMEVSVFEQKKKLGKPCSGLISERIWDFFPENKKLVINEFDKAKIHYPKKTITVSFRQKMLVFDRPKLDAYAASLAEEEGVDINFGTPVKRVFILKNHRPQISAGKVMEFDYVIGCDGANSIVRKCLGKKSRNRLGILTYVKEKRKNIETFATKNGFKWIIPHAPGIAEYGIIERIDKASALFKKFIGRKKTGKMQSAFIPDSLVFAEHPRIALCGDAAGLTKPWSGGGVIWALTAADILADSFPDFKKYEKEVRKKFEPVIFVSKIAGFGAWVAGNYFPFLLKNREIDSDWLF